MYLTPEELRKNMGLTQLEFSTMVCTSLRTYKERIALDKPKWNIYELVNLCKLNKGKIRVKTDRGEYEVAIKELG